MGAPLAKIREQFPALQEKTFFDSAGVGIAPRVAIDAIRAFLDQTMFVPMRSMVEHHIAIDAAREKARPEAARLIGAAEDEIALVESTTHGLSIASRAILGTTSSPRTLNSLQCPWHGVSRGAGYLPRYV